MSPEYEHVQQLAHQLPLEEQMRLANDLMEATGPELFAGDDAAWDAEIARRVAEVEAGTAITYSHDEFAARIQAIRDKHK